MKSNNLFNTAQPRIVWILVTSALIVSLLFIFISHNYHFILYIDAFLFFIIGVIAVIFKWIEIRELRRNKRKVVWFSNKFWNESGFPYLAIAAALLIWGLLLKGYNVLVMIMGFPPLCLLFFMVFVELHALIASFRDETVEGQK